MVTIKRFILKTQTITILYPTYTEICIKYKKSISKQKFLENTVKSKNMLFYYSSFMIQYCYDFNETRFRLAFGVNLGFGYYL